MKIRIIKHAAAVFFAACLTGCAGSGMEDSLHGGSAAPVSGAPATKVAFDGADAANVYTMYRSPEFSPKLVNETAKREPGYNVPTEDGFYNAYFYVRIDGSVPGAGANCAADRYFPRGNSGNSPTTNLNAGLLDADPAIEWRSSQAFDKYMFTGPDGTGSNVEKVLASVPTIESLFAASTRKGDDFSELLEHAGELHVIWYKVKKQKDSGWHVDGILTTKDRTSVAETDFLEDIRKSNPDDEILVPRNLPGEVEVDVHQQEHSNWNEVKTTIHVRDTVDVSVTLPIGEEHLAPADDFLVRTYEAYYTIEGCPYPVAVVATHAKDAVTFEVVGVAPEILRELRENGDDGLTVEIHSYYVGIAGDDLFELLKGTKVETKVDRTTVYGQVHSVDSPASEWIPIGQGIKKKD